jgi:demethylmenaquinone methyltransferase / 2-methoxy-6-polyprenyl-1,4-benzoquinol methylase
MVLEFTKPSGLFFGPLYMFYFRRILPLIGRMIAATAGDAYKYLPQSVQAFAGPAEMSGRMAALGLKQVRAVPMTFGTVHLYVGVK